MTTYYIHATGGNDANDGLTAGAAWATLAYADSQVSAGDTVWLSPGYHKLLSPWEPTASGINGSPILYKGDFLGAKFSEDRGNVILGTSAKPNNGTFVWSIIKSAYYNDYRDIITVPHNISMVDIEWVEFHNMRFEALIYTGSTTRNINLSSIGGVAHYAAEGVRFVECIIESCESKNYEHCIRLDTTKIDADVVDGDEFRVERSLLIGTMIEFRTTESPVASYDLKPSFIGCVGCGGSKIASSGYLVNDTYEVGGGRFLNCSFIGHQDGASFFYTYSDARQLYNSLTFGSVFAYFSGSSQDFAYKDNVFGKGGNGGDLTTAGITSMDRLAIAFGGEGDILHRNLYGWVPFLPFEPIVDGGILSIGAGAYSSDPAPDYDYYGYPNTRASGIAWKFLDGSYEAVTAPGWSAVASICNKDVAQQGYKGSPYTEISLAGVDMSDIEGVIGGRVWILPLCSFSNTYSGTSYYSIDVEYLSEVLLTGERFYPKANNYTGSKAILVPAPSGGWTQDAISKLRVKVLPVSTGGNAYFYEIVVAFELSNAVAIGAVSGKNKLAEETTVVRSGSSGRLEAWSWWEKPMFLTAGSHTFEVYARYENEYTGVLPTLEIVIPEDDASYSDSMTGAADTWEKLSISFSLSVPRTVVLRLRSYNTAQFGYCYFEDLELA